MKKVYLFLLSVVFFTGSYMYAQAPSIDCAGAPTLVVNGACATMVSISDATMEPGVNVANICGSGQSIVREGWYMFQATATTAQITVDANARNATIQIFSGTCGALTEIACANSITTNGAQIETTTATGLTIGVFYYIRVGNVTSNSMNLNSVCVTVPQCNTGNLYVSNFTPVCNGTVQTVASCQFAGEYSIVNLTAGVSYVFGSSIATDFITIATNPGNVVQTGGTQPVSFTPSVTGPYRIYTHSNSACGTAAGCRNLTVQCLNDNPCQATPLPVGVICSYTISTNGGATATVGVPAPGCAGYAGGDVWYTVVVPASGNLNFDTQTGVMLDGGMAVYSGTCNALSLIACDDNSSANGNMPALSLTGLTPGATLWIRVWENGNNNNGTFGICVVNPNPPPNPGDCPSAINVCGNTSFSITPSGSGNIVEFGTGSISNPNINPNCCNSGCLITGEVNSTWLLVTIQTSGMFQVSFGAAGGIGCYDWSMWGPYTPGTCASIAANSLTPIRCNWNGSCNQFTGIANPLPPGGAASSFEQPLAVIAGQQYMFCFSNYSSLTTTVPVSFFGSAGIGCLPLPVQLQSFFCSQKGNRMNIEWVTSAEINNDYFIVERSTDGVNFEDIGTIDGNGNSNATQYYSLQDKNPSTGTQYYRLSQVDFDGQRKTFDMSSCEFNPGEQAEVNIYNMTGQMIHTLNSADYITDVNGLILPVGMYIIEVVSGTGRTYQTHYHSSGSNHWYGQ